MCDLKVSMNGRKNFWCAFTVLMCILIVLWPLPGRTAQKANVPSAKNQELTKLIEGAKKEGKVVWWDGLKPEESEPLIKAFQAKYPFIKVEHTRVHANESRERLFREFQIGQINVDLFDISGEQIPDYRKAGVLEKYDWTKAFPVQPEQLDREQVLLSIGSSMKCVGYNTNLVKPQDVPKRWEDLLDPKWKGKIVVDTRPKTFTQLMPVWGEDRVYEYLKKLAANKPQFRRGQTETIELMAAGAVTMIAGTYRPSMTLVIRKGAPINMEYLDIIPVTLEEEGIAKGSPHSNAAKLLLGWLGTEGQKYYDEVTGRGIPLPVFDTEAARLAKGKKVSFFIREWIDREAELSEKALKALGRE